MQLAQRLQCNGTCLAQRSFSAAISVCLYWLCYVPLLSLLKELYVAEMETCGSSSPLASKSKHAPGNWYATRTDALRRYSITHFGIKEQNPGCLAQQSAFFTVPEPKCWFKLKPCLDHS
eukprot:3589525-Pleurochrysis_carterae.AAC.1